MHRGFELLIDLFMTLFTRIIVLIFCLGKREKGKEKKHIFEKDRLFHTKNLGNLLR
jgi:hypothetical protein